MKYTLNAIESIIKEIESGELEPNKENFIRAVKNVRSELINEIKEIREMTLLALSDLDIE